MEGLLQEHICEDMYRVAEARERWLTACTRREGWNFLQVLRFCAANRLFQRIHTEWEEPDELVFIEEDGTERILGTFQVTFSQNGRPLPTDG